MLELVCESSAKRTQEKNKEMERIFKEANVMTDKNNSHGTK